MEGLTESRSAGLGAARHQDFILPLPLDRCGVGAVLERESYATVSTHMLHPLFADQ